MQATVNAHSGMLSQFLPIVSEREPEVKAASLKTEATPFSVLIMEGSTALARLLATGLAAESLTVEITHDADSTLMLFSQSAYDLAILDMDLPNGGGSALLKRLRETYPNLRILALGGGQGVSGLINALDYGADDYLQKPLSLLELVARVRALRRRSQQIVSVAPRMPSVVLHPEQCQVERDGRRIDLTPREFMLLDYLAQHPGKTLSRALLTQEVWNLPAEGNTNIVDVYIKYLRDKLDGDHDVKMIRTVRGMGYVFQTQA